MTYADFVARLATYLVEEPTEANFVIALPNIIEAAELRCYRDVDFVATKQTSTLAFTIPAGASVFPTPTDYVIGDEVRILPFGTTARSTLSQRSESFLAAVSPDPAAWTLGVRPRYWAERPANIIAIAPTADQDYTVEILYRNRPAPLSATNTTTWLSTHCPDLMFAAAMVAGSAYTKNFGAGSDNPQMALSWEQTYQTALTGALREEGRRKGEGTFDSSRSPPPVSNTP